MEQDKIRVHQSYDFYNVSDKRKTISLCMSMDEYGWVLISMDEFW